MGGAWRAIRRLTLFFRVLSICVVNSLCNSIAGSIATLATPLAQSDDSSSGGATSVGFWSVILFIVVLRLFGGVAWARKRLSHDEDFRGEGFTLSDLRAMVKGGRR